ncbi:MAG: HAD-IIA family hydrolase [Deltaproteobacteria bacterium]|nr:HAD-IIA family hydrolase [Deltaproteobacteria bacterium]
MTRLSFALVVKGMNLRLKQTLARKKVFLFDLDGTLYMGKKLIPGALALIQGLRTQKKKIFFFTNNSSRSVEDYIQKLKGFGFSVHKDEIVMSTHTLISFLKNKNWKNIFLLGTPSMQKMLANEKIKHTKNNPKAVVVGFDKTLTYEKILVACRLIEKKIPLVVTHPDLFCPTDEGPEPDCGAIAKLLELSSGRDRHSTLGKPHPSMIQEVIKRSGRKKSEMILIGDRLSTDVKMGREAGIETILVLSGETKRQHLRAMHSLKPTFVVPSVKELRMIG